MKTTLKEMCGLLNVLKNELGKERTKLSGEKRSRGAEMISTER